MKIFIDDSGSFSWTPHGVSLFSAVTIADRTFDTIASNFSSWKSRQPHFTAGAELKGTDLSQLQQASFVNSVILNTTGLALTLAGTRTTLFKKEIAQQFINDAANVLRAVPKAHDGPLVGDFFRRMARWVERRSPENLMWIYCLADAIHLAIQHSIVTFMEQAHDSEFQHIEVLIDQSFIEKTTHIEFWREWLRNIMYSKSVKKPMMIPKQWAERNHPFNKYRTNGIIVWSELFRNQVNFGKSKDSLGLQIADISANICYRRFSGKHRYRPYRLIRPKVAGEHGTEIHYGVLDESSLLADAPENHISGYTEKEQAAIAEFEARRQQTQP